MITHLACIMDGNRRWAKKRGLTPWLGHREGVKAVERTIDFCLERKIKHLSLYTFSIENFNRSEKEKNFLFNILINEIKNYVIELARKKNIRIRFIGDRALFPRQLIPVIEKMEQETVNNTTLIVYVLFCYGGRQELVAAVKTIVADVKSGKIDQNDISEQLIAQSLWMNDVPDPDIILRTGGAQRLSNFLLYRAAYSELFFTDTFWPDITDKELTQAVEYFQQCRRNFGA